MAEGGRTWRTWQLLVGMAITLVIGIVAGAGTPDDEKTVSTGAQATSSTLSQVQVTQASTVPRPTPAPTAAPTTPAPTPAPTTAAPGPKTEFGNGTYRVGVDIAAGTYSAPGGSGCYWERQSVFGGGGVDAIIANEFAPGGGQVVVTILATDKGFKTSGCGTWRKA